VWQTEAEELALSVKPLQKADTWLVMKFPSFGGNQRFITDYDRMPFDPTLRLMIPGHTFKWNPKWSPPFMTSN
jgi:hypothetical protein